MWRRVGIEFSAEEVLSGNPFESLVLCDRCNLGSAANGLRTPNAEFDKPSRCVDQKASELDGALLSAWRSWKRALRIELWTDFLQGLNHVGFLEAQL